MSDVYTTDVAVQERKVGGGAGNTKPMGTDRPEALKTFYHHIALKTFDRHVALRPPIVT